MSLKQTIAALWQSMTGRGPEPRPVVPSLWSNLLERDGRPWQRARDQAQGPRILIATSLGGFNHAATLESALAAALTWRGAQVEVLLCDSYLPACQLTKIVSLPAEQFLASRPMPRCGSCQASGRHAFEALGLPIRWYSELVTREEAEQARRSAAAIPLEQLSMDYRPGGLAVGEHALAGALRYYARGDFDEEPSSPEVRRRFLEASLLTVHAVQRLLQQRTYDVVCIHHGLYVPQGLIGEVCRQHGVRVVTWNPAYRKHCFIFSHSDTYHQTMIAEPVSDWENLEWTADREARTLQYLKSRWQGTEDWIWFHERPQEDVNKIAAELGVDFSRPCIGLLTNVMWDAVLHYKSNAFPSMLDWVLRTIGYFRNRPEMQLLIRVHPAEVRGLTPSRQMLVPELRRAFPTLPPNVFVIPPESQVSTYAVMEQCNSVIIYNTKTGIEVSTMGVPVIVAGEAWIRNKGFSLDAETPDEYFALLDRLPLQDPLSHDLVQRARKYAYHFFFRRMIPLPFIVSKPGLEFQLALATLQDLRPGTYSGLDTICDGILKGAKFIYSDPERTTTCAA
jgi:hypothetical protein